MFVHFIRKHTSFISFPWTKAFLLRYSIIAFMKNINIIPVELMVHTATGVMQASQSRGVNRLLLHTAPLLFTQISHDNGSEVGYAEVEHSKSVIWWTNGFFVWLKIIFESINAFKKMYRIVDFKRKSLLKTIFLFSFIYFQ